MPGRLVNLLSAIGLCGVSGLALAQGTELLWGDTHLQTSNSTDGYTGPATIATAADAFRYARGIPVIHETMRTRVRISRPLDFLVVADHADLMGMQIWLDRRDPRLLQSPIGQRLLALHEAAGVFHLVCCAVFRPEYFIVNAMNLAIP